MTDILPLLIYVSFIMFIWPLLPKRREISQEEATDMFRELLRDPKEKLKCAVMLWNDYITAQYNINKRLYDKLKIDDIENIEEKKRVIVDSFWNEFPYGESSEIHDQFDFKILKMVSELYPKDIIIFKYL